MTAARSRDLVRTLALNLAPETERIARSITDRVRTEMTELRGLTDTGFWQAAEEGTRANLDAGLAVLAGRVSTPVTAPLDASFAARMVATHGIALSTLLRAYLIGHRVAWAEWLRAVDALDISPAQRTDVLERGSTILFAYVDRVVQLVADEYTHELDHAVRDREQRRLQRVRDLVDGTGVDTRDLDYDLSLEHVAVVATGDGVEPALRTIAAELDARILVVAATPETTWGWLGGRALGERPWRAALDRHAPAQAWLGTGDPREGEAGFRVSHHQARDAVLVGRRLGVGSCHFRDVALEALALRDEQFARRFIEGELRGMAGADDRSAKLRATLRAYFASDHSAVATAARLGIHDQTVANRLRRVEECIGGPVGSRRAELEVALRLERLLSA